MTAALDGSEWSAARPGRTLPPGKTRYPFYRRLVGPQGLSGRAENLVPNGVRSRTVQSVVSQKVKSDIWKLYVDRVDPVNVHSVEDAQDSNFFL